ncbi:MAG: hypothetical protein ACLUB2_00600 [Butyricicoccus pullicaecorum]
MTSTPVDIDIKHAGNSLTVMLEAFGYDTYVRNYPDQTTGMRVFVNNRARCAWDRKARSCSVPIPQKADWKLPQK